MRSDLTLAVLAVARRPVVSAAIVVTIAGALAVTAIGFAVLDGVLLRPLPYPTPERLVTIWERSLTRDVSRNVTSPANYFAWRESFTTVEQLAAVFETSGALAGDGEPEQVGLVLTAGPFFSLIGGTPILGRYYGPAEDVDGGPPVVVITEGLWRRRYGADRSIVGRTIQLNGQAREILGVLPDRLAFAPAMSFGAVGSRDVYLPAQFGPPAREAGGRWLQVLGRLAPGATLATAAEEARTIAGRLREQFPDRQADWGINLVSLQGDVVGDVRTPITVIFAAVCLVLLIACANVANLLMARASERQGELAIRSALGAGRMALARQVLGESTLMAALGGAIGVVLSFWGVRALLAAAPDLPRLDEVRVDGAVIAFTALASLAVAGLIGIGPAMAAAGGSSGIRLAPRGAGSDRRANRVRRGLAGLQVALAVVLVVGAGLLVRSLIGRMSVDVGISGNHVVTAQLSLPGSRYPDPGRRTAVFEDLVERVSALPGVGSAAVASIIPMTEQGQSTGFIAIDRPRPEAGQQPVADVRFVDHRYFGTMGIRLLSGRGLEPTDRPGMPVAVVINETGARLLWPGESAVGKRIEMEWGDTLRAEIVGVVGDVRLNRPDEAVDRTTLYWDYRQLGVPNSMTLVVRGVAADPPAAPIRAALAAIDPALPLFNLRSVGSLRAAATAQSSFITKAVMVFSVLAIVLAALGVYGVVAYGIQQRTREIGVRLALGAERHEVIRMLVAEAGRVLGPALVAGAIAALFLTRFLRSLVFGVSPHDPATLASGLAIIAGVALAACWVPARRASAISPVEAIRTD